MCERYACYLDLTFERDWNLATRAPAFTSYNIGPDCEVPIVRHDDHGRREAVTARWGLVPAAAHAHRRRGARLQVSSTRLGRDSTAQPWQQGRRCIFPVLGFYLWQQGEPQPFFASLAHQRLFGVAGVWDASTDPATNLHVLSAAMITVPAGRLAAELHGAARIPAVLAPDDYDEWLGGAGAQAQGLLRATPHREIRLWRVGAQVNDPAHKGPACMAAASA